MGEPALAFQYDEVLDWDWPESFDEDEIKHELWRRGDLEFLLWEQQFPIWDKLKNLPAHVVEFVVLCARQFGKSVLGVIYALSEAIKHRDVCILIVGPDIKQTIDIVAPRMRRICQSAPAGLIVPMKASNRYHVYHDGNRDATDYTEIIIAGFNENSSSQRGKTVHRIIIEEIVDVPEDDFLTAIRSDLGPAMLHSENGKIVYLTTPPKYPAHPFVTETLVQAKLDDALAIFTINDNIALTPQKKANAIKLAGGISSIDYKREYLCEIVRDPRIICLPDYDETRNVRIFTLPLIARLSTTIDWGGVRDKTCAILHCYDYLQNKHMLWDERVFDPNTSTTEILKGVREMEGQYIVFNRNVDAPPQLLIDLMQDHNYPCRLPQKDDWQAALNNLNVAMGVGTIWIHPRCKFLRVSAESGILNKNKTDFDRNDALGHMDGVAAMMYALRMQDLENPYGQGDAALDYLQANQIPARSQDTREVIQQSEVIIPKAFGRYRTA